MALWIFSGERFANTSDPKEITDEIALNPVHFATRKPVEVLSTLVHEMVHLWQHHFGERARKGYHDRQWAGKMLARAHSNGNGGDGGEANRPARDASDRRKRALRAGC